MKYTNPTPTPTQTKDGNIYTHTQTNTHTHTEKDGCNATKTKHRLSSVPLLSHVKFKESNRGNRLQSQIDIESIEPTGSAVRLRYSKLSQKLN